MEANAKVSRGIREQIEGDLRGARSMRELEQIGRAITPEIRRQMTEEDSRALRAVYLVTRQYLRAGRDEDAAEREAIEGESEDVETEGL